MVVDTVPTGAGCTQSKGVDSAQAQESEKVIPTRPSTRSAGKHVMCTVPMATTVAARIAARINVDP